MRLSHRKGREMDKKQLTAHDIAASPELFNIPVRLTKTGKESYECMGYSRPGGSIRFARLEQLPEMKLHQINIYVYPDTPVFPDPEAGIDYSELY